ncbi:MAG: HI0074 family nucleotidyltransferase substrate-binding subunit [Bdellovibrionota bacterium]
MTKLQQSFKNLERSFQSLKRAVATPPIEERDYAGIIQSFEFVYELTWQTLKILLESNGIKSPFPRITFEEAFKRDLIEGNEVWKLIMDARNKTSHTYDQKLAVSLCKEITENYITIFEKTIEKVKSQCS